jgi:hypothetical protein
MKEDHSMPIKKSAHAKSLSPDYIREIAYGFQKSRVLLTAYELGIFSALGNRRKTSREVAESIDTDPRATDRLMNALCAIDLLTKRQNKFSHTQLAAHYL